MVIICNIIYGGMKMEEKTRKILITAAVIIIIAVVATIAVLKSSVKANNNVECGQKICAGLNQEYRGWTQGTLQCTYNYERYGLPWLSEVFTFTMTQEEMTRVCEQLKNFTVPSPEIDTEIIPADNTTANVTA